MATHGGLTGKKWRAVFAAALGVVALTAGLAGCTKGKIPETEAESRQVLLEAANSAGESPWMGSVATATVTDDLPAELQAELSSAQPAPSSGQVATADAPIAVSGDKVGLYGGSTGVAVCDRERWLRSWNAIPCRAMPGGRPPAPGISGSTRTPCHRYC